jgi:RNA polymerase sigma-70 factor, ECF subfamily
MQELVLHPPAGTLEDHSTREAQESTTRQDFERQLCESAPLAFRVAYGVLRNAADAEDVAQDALLRAYRAFSRLRDPARFRAWIVRISFRIALDRWRANKRRETRESAWSQPANLAPPSTEQLAASQEFERRLDRALDELPKKLQVVIILSAIRGHTVEEVSRLLEIPVGTVKSRLFNARKLLAEKLK